MSFLKIRGFIYWIKVIFSRAFIFTLWKCQMYYFHSVINTSFCDVKSDMYCMQCPRIEKNKEYLTIGHWIWNLFQSCKYQKSRLTCEINSILNVKPFNIIYLSPLGKGCGPSFEKKLNFLSPRMLWAQFGWNRSSDSWTEVKNVKKFTDRQMGRWPTTCNKKTSLVKLKFINKWPILK